MSAVAHAVEPGVHVIAAAYADAGALDPPALAPQWLPALVDRTAIAGALVDTFVKDGRGLYGYLSPRELADLIDATHALGGASPWPGSCAWASWVAWGPTWSECAPRCVAGATVAESSTGIW